MSGAASGGTVIWVTGLPGAGKSTLAAHVAERLRQLALPCAILDGDEVRAALGRPAGRGAEDRDAFYEILGRLAALLARQGLAVVVPATANRAAHRERARALAPRWIEVHVATPVAECERRDPRGLYAAARAGVASGVPGVDAAYEPPAAPDVVASGGEDRAAADRVVTLLAQGPAAAAPSRSPTGAAPASRPFVPSPRGSSGGHARTMPLVCGTGLSDGSRPALAAQPGASLGPEGFPAVRRVLVATDLSAASTWATSFAYALVGRAGGDVHLLHVARPPGKEEEPPDLAARLRALVPRIAEREGITTHVEIARGAVVREICSAAERLGVDVICLASHGESGIKTFLGSVVSGVLRESTKPVLVLHPPPP